MKRKVLYTASTYSHLFNFHRPYLAEFRRLGWQVDVACGGAEMELPEADRVIHLPFVKRMTAPENFRAVRMLHREMAQEQYDLVSTHTSLAAFFTRLAVRGLQRRPLVVNVVHGYLFDGDTNRFKRSILYGAERITAPVTDLLLTMNDWDTQFAHAHHLGAQVAEIPGIGVQFDHLTPSAGVDRSMLRGEWGFSSDAFVLIYAAEFSTRKNQAMLIRTMSQLPERVGLLLPGDGALRQNCIDLARQIGVADRVVFPGQVREMGPWYAAADCAVSASRSEGLPFNIMEAMYLGLPVVASAVKGHVDLIRQKETGLLYPFQNEGAFVKAVETLLDRPDFAAQLGQNAAQAMEPYRLSAVLPQVMAHYHALVPMTPELAASR